jgi:hypothetical protein
LQGVHHGAGRAPSALFVESGGALISNRAGEPRGLDPSVGKPGFGIRYQPGRGARTTRRRRHEELIDFVAFHDAEADRGARWPDHSNLGQVDPQPLPETLQRAQPCEFGRDDLGMCLMPSIEPELRQPIELGFLRGSHHHCVATIHHSSPQTLAAGRDRVACNDVAQATRHVDGSLQEHRDERISLAGLGYHFSDQAIHGRFPLGKRARVRHGRHRGKRAQQGSAAEHHFESILACHSTLPWNSLASNPSAPTCKAAPAFRKRPSASFIDGDVMRWCAALFAVLTCGCVTLTRAGAQVGVYRAPLRDPPAERNMPEGCRLLARRSPVSMSELDIEGQKDPFRPARNETAAAGGNTLLVLSRMTISRRDWECPASSAITDCPPSGGAWFRVVLESYACTPDALRHLSAARWTG